MVSHVERENDGVVVSVRLSLQTARCLVLMQEVLQLSAGELIDESVCEVLPKWRGYAVGVAEAGELPEGFDLSVLALKAVKLGRASRRRMEKKGKPGIKVGMR